MVNRKHRLDVVLVLLVLLLLLSLLKDVNFFLSKNCALKFSFSNVILFYYRGGSILSPFILRLQKSVHVHDKKSGLGNVGN